MHRISTLLLALLPLAMQAEIINITTPASSYVIEANEGKPLQTLYYGSPLSDAEAASLRDAGIPGRDTYPAFGNWPENETALSLTHPDGNMTLDLAVSGNASTRTAKDGGRIISIPMRDRHYPVEVTINFRTYPGNDITETWAEIRNDGRKPITLRRFDSAYLPVRRQGDTWLTSFYGGWANEARINNEPLTAGTKVIRNTDGLRNSHTEHAEAIISLDGRPAEDHGRVIGAALEYGGNYKLRIDTDPSDFHHFFAGINSDDASYRLKPGETFTTPPLALAYSDTGLGALSRSFHKWGREHRLNNGDKLHPILLNSWEGVYFNIDEPAMAGMMSDIAKLGGELFVMDDGWFGDRYQRNTDNAALGDWTVDTRKLPNGINGLINEAKKNNIKFGIWIEPEMTNSISRLYETHPEYIIKAANRTPIEGRGGTQLVLDLSNPKVQDLMFNMVDTLLSKYPDIAYIKWDANAPVMQYGSQYLSAEQQPELDIRMWRGLESVLNRIRAKYPDVMIQACASGGGRVNYGILPWFDEFWTSDNTDARQRINMQWGTSMFFPAIAMGSHVSVVPNHTTHAMTPLKYRTDVAMTGRMGFEMQPSRMSKEDYAFSAQALKCYRDTIRPIVQLGDLYRGISPYDNRGVATMTYVSPDKSEAVYFWFRTDTSYGNRLPRVTMKGLDPEATYVVTEMNRLPGSKNLPFEGKRFTGKSLMTIGLEIPAGTNYDSRVFLIRGV